MFAPKWKKEAKLLYKGANKFLNYKRDLLADEKIADIEAKRADLLAAMKAGDQKACSAAEKLLTSACDRSLSGYHRQGWIEENVEVFFVAIVVALGIRAYYLQPFRIPTGSMQPTLNGITGEYLEHKDFPSFPVRMAQKVLRGRTYVYEELDHPRTFISNNAGQCIVQVQKYNFFTYTQLHFTDGILSIPAPLSVVLDELKLNETIGLQGGRITRTTLPQGTVIASGHVSSGDLVLVDKVSYNFRRPTRGEVWVFDTRGIEGIHKSSGDQAAGSHYIKRLAGVPGDSLQIQPPRLYVNGKLPKEKKLLEVMNRTGSFENPVDGEGNEILVNVGYELADPRNARVPPVLFQPDQNFHLQAETPIGMREYFSLGDNTDNSLDSRYWGAVHEYNAVGPALFSLWPFTTGHWGFIR